MQVKLRLILLPPASALTIANCKCQSGDESFIDVTTFCCTQQAENNYGLIILYEDKCTVCPVHLSGLKLILKKKMDRALNRSLTQANSAAAVRYMVSVIGVGSFTKTG